MSQKSVEACTFVSVICFPSLALPLFLSFSPLCSFFTISKPYEEWCNHTVTMQGRQANTPKHIQSFWNQTTLAIFNLHLFWLHSQIENLICLFSVNVCLGKHRFFNLFVCIYGSPEASCKWTCIQLNGLQMFLFILADKTSLQDILCWQFWLSP